MGILLNLSVISLAAALLFIVLAAVLFVIYRIPRIRHVLSGKAANEEIEELRSSRAGTWTNSDMRHILIDPSLSNTALSGYTPLTHAYTPSAAGQPINSQQANTNSISTGSMVPVGNAIAVSKSIDIGSSSNSADEETLLSTAADISGTPIKHDVSESDSVDNSTRLADNAEYVQDEDITRLADKKA